MAHVGHSWLKTKPGSYKKVCDRYHQFASEVLAHNADLHDVIIVGNQAQNTIEGYGIWENPLVSMHPKNCGSPWVLNILPYGAWIKKEGRKKPIAALIRMPVILPGLAN